MTFNKSLINGELEQKKSLTEILVEDFKKHEVGTVTLYEVNLSRERLRNFTLNELELLSKEQPVEKDKVAHLAHFLNNDNCIILGKLSALGKLELGAVANSVIEEITERVKGSSVDIGQVQNAIETGDDSEIIDYPGNNGGKNV